MRSFYYVSGFLLSGLLLFGCGGSKKSFIRKMEEQNLTAGVRQPGKTVDTTTYDMPKEVKIKTDGRDDYISFTTKDKDGSDIASYALQEVRVVAKNKTVPERDGKVNVDFVVSIPKGLVDKNWQVHILPKITKDVTRDSLFLDDVFITGERFDDKRREGYEKYQSYMESIIPDSADFVQNYVDYRMYYMTLDRKNLFANKYRKKVLKARDRYNNWEYIVNRRFLHYNQYPEFQLSKKRGENPTTTMAQLTGGAQEALSYLGMADQGAMEKVPVNWMLRDIDLKHVPARYRKYILDEEDNPDLLMLSRVDSLLWMDFYTRYGDVESNNAKKRKSEEMYDKYVKFPFSRNARLDSIVDKGKDIEYYYSQDVHVDEANKRLYLTLQGEVTTLDDVTYQMPASDTIVYTISNMLNFLDRAPRYVKKVLERRAFENYSAQIVFPVGRADFNLELGNNKEEVAKVEKIVREVDETGEFVVDSIIMTATCSPEGAWAANESLARRRSQSMGRFFQDRQNEDVELSKLIKDKYLAEDWDKLVALLEKPDSLNRVANRSRIVELIKEVDNADAREARIRSEFPEDYKVIKELYYPELRAVNFEFNMHRKGMIKDTIHTNVIDETYAHGVELLDQRRYKDALEILLEYEDINTAICYMSMGYDVPALRLLEREEQTADVVYLRAVIYARQKDYPQAIEFYQRAVKMDPSKAWRGSLDPEINKLIQAYDLNKSLFED
ncbi:MAG: tetratricopeptide repeat protein [Parabacteroides sp.]